MGRSRRSATAAEKVERGRSGVEWSEREAERKSSECRLEKAEADREREKRWEDGHVAGWERDRRILTWRATICYWTRSEMSFGFSKELNFYQLEFIPS